MSFFDFFKRKDPVETAEVIEAHYEEAVQPVGHKSNDSLPVRLSKVDLAKLENIQSLGTLGNRIADAYLESKRINANIKALRIATSSDLKKHAEQIAYAKDCLAKVFSERSVALNKHYAVLDRALRSDDRELIIASLQGISSIVVANPLDSIAANLRALNSDKPLQLDF